MMSHESDGTIVQEWTSRCLICRHCGFDYIQQRDEDSDCPACGAYLSFDVLEEYFD